MRTAHGWAFLILAAMIPALSGSLSAPASAGSFAGTWRCVGGNRDAREMLALELRIEERQGEYHAVRIAARDRQRLEFAAEATKYIAGALTRRGPRALGSRRKFVEQIEDGQLTVVVINSFHLDSDASRLRLDTQIYPEGYEREKLTATWEFERVGEVPETAAAASRQSHFELLRPTFHDALRVQATGRQALSSRPLEAGASYRVRVAGSIALAAAVAGKWVVADAAFVFHAERNSSFFGQTPIRSELLLINGRPFEPAQGFSTTHIYTMDLEGTGEPLSAVVTDPLPEDNEGTLDIRIYRLRRDLLLAERPSTIDSALAPIDRILDAERYSVALSTLRDAVRQPRGLREREMLYQLIGVMEFVLSRPWDPEELRRDVVMEATHPFGRAIRFDARWPSALNNLAVWQAWNANVFDREGNARSQLEEARRLAPDDAVIGANLTRIRAEALENR